MSTAPGVAAVPVAVIDGPYDATALSGILAHAPVSLGDCSCGVNSNSACRHGTFVMGLLGARRDSAIPGLCPECTLLHVPLFTDESAPQATISELAKAITTAVAAGARLINLSLAVLGDETQRDGELAAALDYAEASGAVVVVAAGNQGRLAMGQLLTHPVTIPVVAVDAMHRLLPECNFGPAISRRGIAALGHRVPGHAPGNGIAVMSGTSVATAVATGTLAQLWSAHPEADGADIRRAVARLTPRNGAIPPMIDRSMSLTAFDDSEGTAAVASFGGGSSANYARLQGAMKMRNGNGQPIALERGAEPAATRTSLVAPANGPGGCACGAPGGVCTCTGNQESSSGFVYAIGTVEAEYPNVAIEREMQIMADALEVEAKFDEDMPMRPTEDRSWQHAVLSTDRKRTRYLARQLSWRLTIEEYPAFVLKPRDPRDFDDLIDCLGRPKYLKRAGTTSKKGAKGRSTRIDPPFGSSQDLDVVVGVRGSTTPDGIEVLMDQIFTIPPAHLAPGGRRYFAQLSDNYGLTDEDRAYNFLAARYTISPENMNQKEFEIAGVPISYSRLSAGDARVVRVIFTFRGTKIPVEKKYFVRVDVTHEFPIITHPWQEYLERGEGS